ncbi:MAG TPA: antibiotic biosynthesis monooxygenase [Thermomicrobiales bacterium]|jgi:quinol monooxygenase YgiN
MSVMMIRAKVQPEHVADLEAAARQLFAALHEAQPQGIRYGSCRLADGATYVILLEIEEGFENPLPTLPEFQAFQAGLRGWLAEPPIPEPLAVIGTYRLF